VGEAGMAEMGEMGMKVPRNSIPMVGSPGPHDYITMGGMYTNIKVRPDLKSYDQDPGWYEQPAGTRASIADPEKMKRDLGFLPDAKPGGSPPKKHEHRG
jgi:hypothetical protein